MPHVERLENRAFLADVAAAFAGAFHGKLDGELLGMLKNPGRPVLSVDSDRVHADLKGRVQLDLRVRGKLNSAKRDLEAIGATVSAANEPAGMVEVWADPATLNDIASLGSIGSIRLPDYRVVRAGSVNTAGDALLGADKVRAQFAAYGIDGSGIKIGVISDGVDHRNSVGADLSSITIEPSKHGEGDEGTAMLEIIHDLAPAAQLYFSGPETSVEMAGSITWLKNQGCSVIVDDLGFFNEPFFADGTLAQAVQSAVNAGVIYVSAAGNESTPAGQAGSFHYQHQFSPGSGERPFHDFADGPAVDQTMSIVVAAKAKLNLALQWSDPFGASGNDYDLFVYGDEAMADMLASSVDSQDGTGDPLEILNWKNTGNVPRTVRIAIQKFGGAARELELFGFADDDITALEYSTPGDAIFGHTAAAGAIAVGAINAADPGSDDAESFSSRGPSTIYTDFASQQKSARNSLTGMAIDGVQTRVGQIGQFDNPFFGTSAAAPHAAAIAALIKEANPALTPAQVGQIMQDTAVDLTAYGAGYDPVSGSGRFNALDAVFRAFLPGSPDLDAASDTGASQTDNLTNDPTPTFTGTAPAGAFVQLLIDGTPQASVQLGANVSSYALTAPELADGGHAIAIRVGSSSAATASFSNASINLGVTIDRTAPTMLPVGFDSQNSLSLVYTLSEDVSATLAPDDLTLRREPGNVPVNANAIVNVSQLSGQFQAKITLSGIANPMLTDGDYSAGIETAGVSDAAGNALAAPSDLGFFLLAGDANRDRVVNALDFGALASHFGATGAQLAGGDFNYDGVVNSLDFAALAANFNNQLPSNSEPEGAAPAMLQVQAASLWEAKSENEADGFPEVLS